jgi:hypothetical protein
VPSLGRFASADTIVPDPTNPQAFNRFSYTRNNPINRIDPSGHCDYSHAAIENGVDQDCRDIVDYLVRDHGYDAEKIKGLNWRYNGNILSAEKNGNEFMNYELLIHNGQKVSLDGFDIYSLTYAVGATLKVLAMDKGETSTKVLAFKNATDKFVTSISEFDTHRSNIVTGSQFGAAALYTIGFGAFAAESALAFAGGAIAETLGLAIFSDMINTSLNQLDAYRHDINVAHNQGYNSMYSLVAAGSPYRANVLDITVND